MKLILPEPPLFEVRTVLCASWWGSLRQTHAGPPSTHLRVSPSWETGKAEGCTGTQDQQQAWHAEKGWRWGPSQVLRSLPGCIKKGVHAGESLGEPDRCRSLQVKGCLLHPSFNEQTEA